MHKVRLYIHDDDDFLMKDITVCALVSNNFDTMPYNFKLKFSLGFITSCYVILSLSMVQAMDIFMITQQDVRKRRENCNLKLPNVSMLSLPQNRETNTSPRLPIRRKNISTNFITKLVCSFVCVFLWPIFPNVTQRQLMRLFAVKLILNYEQKCKNGQNFSKIKVCLKTKFDINSMSSETQTNEWVTGNYVLIHLFLISSIGLCTNQ